MERKKVLRRFAGGKQKRPVSRVDKAMARYTAPMEPKRKRRQYREKISELEKPAVPNFQKATNVGEAREREKSLSLARGPHRSITIASVRARRTESEITYTRGRKKKASPSGIQTTWGRGASQGK